MVDAAQTPSAAADASVRRMALATKAQAFLLEHEHRVSTTVQQAWHDAWKPVLDRAKSSALVTPDDVNAFRHLWRQKLKAVSTQLGELYQVGAMSAMQRAGVVPPLDQARLVAAASDPQPAAMGVGTSADAAFDVINQRTIDYVAGAENRLKDSGDVAWGQARASLSQGVAGGEALPALQQRIQDALDAGQARATLIARTEVHAASTAGSLDGMQALGDSGLQYKTWNAVMDDRTREEHADADGQTVALDDTFNVGGDEYDVPDDPNCRCVLTYGNSPDGTDDAAIQDGSWQDDPENPDGPMQWVPDDTTLRDDASTMHADNVRAADDTTYANTLSSLNECTRG